MWTSSVKSTASSNSRAFGSFAGGRLFRGLALLGGLLLGQQAGLAADCGLDRADETVSLQRVIDGDTIRLSDGRKVRFSAINTPEIARGKRPAEPFGKQAKERLRQLIAGKTLLLRHDKRRHDKYKRLLSHVFLADGTNVQAWLLEQGLAIHSLEPPNLWRTDCYAAKEREARQARRGLWRHPRYQPLQARRAQRENTGFYRVSGRVQDIERTKGRIWLRLSDTLALRIEKRDRRYFPAGMLEKLAGKRVIAKGWVFPYRDGLNLRLRHPAALEIIE